MAEQHGTEPAHHPHAPHVPEEEFFDRARERLDQALRNITEIEERLSKNLTRSRDGKPKADG